MGDSENRIKKKGILVVSFGTSYNETRKASIEAIEQAIADAFPEFSVRRAFTSRRIIKKLRERDGLVVEHVVEALLQAAEDGIHTMIVQPTHMMAGFEYMALANVLEENRHRFAQLILGEPLLSSKQDDKAVVQAVTEANASYDDGRTAICLMGHGTDAGSNQIYRRFQQVLRDAGFVHYYIGTVEAEPSLKDIVAAVREVGTYQKVVLSPLMVVAGDHANHDMAGADPDSWKCVFEAEGYKVECILRGLGELPAIQALYVAHARAAMNRLAEIELGKK